MKIKNMVKKNYYINNYKDLPLLKINLYFTQVIIINQSMEYYIHIILMILTNIIKQNLEKQVMEME